MVGSSVLTFFWELPLDWFVLGDLIASEDPLVLERVPTLGPAAGLIERSRRCLDRVVPVAVPVVGP
jgi:hypothetical protein